MWLRCWWLGGGVGVRAGCARGGGGGWCRAGGGGRGAGGGVLLVGWVPGVWAGGGCSHTFFWYSSSKR